METMQRLLKELIEDPEPELRATRGMFGELDTRPPSISKGSGAEALSQRELEIARLAARRKSNKAIAKELGISKSYAVKLSKPQNDRSPQSVPGHLGLSVRQRKFAKGLLEGQTGGISGFQGDHEQGQYSPHLCG